MPRIPAPLYRLVLPAVLILALAALPSLAQTTSAQPTQAERFFSACMAAEQNESYCQCAADLFLQGLTPEELSMFLSYLETEDDSDSAFLESMLPQDKLTALFEQADATCYGTQAPPASGQSQDDLSLRLTQQCLDSEGSLAYCQCSVERIAQALNPQEMELVVLYLEEQDPDKADQYLAQLDTDKVDQVFNSADQVCTMQSEPDQPYTPTTGDPIQRFVTLCVDDGEDPGTCQCFVERMAERVSAQDIHMLLDALEAEDAGKWETSEWIYDHLDNEKMEAAFNYASQACGVDM